MTNRHAVTCDAYPVVTEETTVWKFRAVVADDDEPGRTVTVEADETYASQREALAAAAAAVRKLDRFRAGIRQHDRAERVV